MLAEWPERLGPLRPDGALEVALEIEGEGQARDAHGLAGEAAMNLQTVPPGVPFLDALARRWLRESGPDPLACADGLILLPTRRSARALQEAFLRAGEGKALLLPRIGALGAVDEAPLQLAGALDLPPAVPEAERLALLARLVMARAAKGDRRRDRPVSADQAWLLAQELARLIDEAHRAGVDLPDRLPDAAAEGYAEHWARTIDFLRIVTRAWPDILADRDMLDPAERGVRAAAGAGGGLAARAPAAPRRHRRHERGQPRDCRADARRGEPAPGTRGAAGPRPRHA